MTMDRAIYANANALLLPLGDKSVHMIATSPPYFGLRSYDTGDNKAAELGAERIHDCLAWARGDEPCGACYVCNMRTWAREMWRVLRDDGVMFLNLGDSYAGNNNGYSGDNRPSNANGAISGKMGQRTMSQKNTVGNGLKNKDLTGIPWRVALALQADGWYLRSDIIWAKPNPMPESVTDRATKSHEYIFMLAKSQRYYFDAEAVREELSPATIDRDKSPRGRKQNGGGSWESLTGIEYTPELGNMQSNPAGRNIRTVWQIATAPYSGAHYATWPPALVERMVKAGTSERGVCPECGKPWERVVQRESHSLPVEERHNRVGHNGAPPQQSGWFWKPATVLSEGWRPTCAHTDAAPVPAIVLDPFAGSGTTLMVARQLGRVGLGFDLSEKYLRENAAVRLGHDKLAAWGNGIKDERDHSDMPLFAGVTP